MLVDEQTGLDMYGRKVTVWYDDRDAGAKGTYAVLDKSTLVKTVYSADDAKLSDGTAAADAKLGLAAQAAGFSVDLNESTTHWSYAYSKFWEGSAVVSQTVASVGEKSAVKTYTLISNNSNKTVDAVIVQDLEVARIEKKDTTSIPATLNLGKLTGDSGYNAPASAFTTTDPAAVGVLEINKLVKNSVQDVGKVVLATKVVGTVDVDGNPKDWGNAGTKANNLCSYKLEEPLETVSGVISTYKADTHDITSVTIGDKTYDRSGIAEATKDINWIIKKLTDNTNSDTESMVEAGVRFKLYLDKAGRFIGGHPESDKSFLYGTYADYQLGGLSTGDIEYFITGVNWDGEKVISHKLITVNTNNIKDGANYNGLTVNQKKLAGDIIDNSNKFNTSYMIDEAGNLSTTVEGARQFTGHYWDGAADATMQWEITADDVARGFKKVTNSGTIVATATSNTDYLLTSATKFIVVSGTGTSTLDVKIYNGIKELMGSGTNVVIGYDHTGATASKNHVWFQTESDYYNKADVSNNQRIATVILSDKNLLNFNASNLYLSDSNAPTGVKLNGPAADVANVEQYVLWNNGVKGTYFVDTSVSSNITDTSAADGVDHSGAAAFSANIQKYGFYTLAPYKEINGVTVYRATETLRNVANNEGGWTANVYDEVEIDSYNGFANLASAIIGGKEYNITGANVADVAYENDTETNKLLRNPIDSLEKLQKAVSEEHNTLKVCFVYGENDLVTDIYVTTYTSNGLTTDFFHNGMGKPPRIFPGGFPRAQARAT